MDDAAILREIARRIRDGIDGTPPGKPSPPDVLPTAATTEAHEAEIMARLAHELKNPLSAMIAAAEIMSAQRLGPLENPTYLSYARDIAESGRHALTIIDRAVKNWREPAAPAELEFIELDLNGIVERTASVLRPIARDRSMTITTRLDERLPHLIADQTSLRQILLNLVINATRYADTGGDIVIATRYVVDGPVILEVSDSGPGMSAALIAQVTTADREGLPRIAAVARTEHAADLGTDGGIEPGNGQGTGQGLLLVRRLAAANGAAFEIASAPGTGTSIKLSFAKGKVVPV